MRFIEFLTEAAEDVGVVVSTSNGRFYDIDFVDYRTRQPLSGHFANLGRSFINYVRNSDAWQDVPEFFAKNFRGHPLGEDYSSEDADFVLYGPLSEQELSSLKDAFARTYGYDI